MIYLILVIILILYVIIVDKTGMGIPCLFRLFTHLKCPGCGITHSLIALLHGNIYQAFKYHDLFILSLPFVIYLLVVYLYRYHKYHKYYLLKYENSITWILVILYVVRCVIIDLFFI